MGGVLVVGAGPTGLTMACELARHGVRARIVDKAAAPSVKSKAFAIHARSLELFENMGIVEAMLAAGRPASGVSFYDTGASIATIELVGKIASKYPFIQIIAQSDAERVLAEHLASYGIEVEREVELVAVAQDDDGVDVQLRGRDGTVEGGHFDAVVGSDGAHSTVRKQLGLAFDGAPYPSQWLLADVDLDWRLSYDELSIFFHRTGTTAFFPLEGRRGRLMFEVPQAPVDEPQPEPTLDDVRRLCAERSVSIVDVANPTWLAWFRLHHRMVDRYAVGRVFVAGDAAHIHSPVGGQGMNMGIQDAYNLAWKLALVLRGKARASLLDSYHIERHRVDRETVGLTHRATTMATIHNPVLNAIRKMALHAITRLDGVQARIAATIAQIELHYRKSPIVGEVWRGRLIGLGEHELRPGERVPDFELRRTDDDAPIALYDLLTGSEHELLMFCGEQPGSAEMTLLARVAQEVAARYGDLIEVHLVHGDTRPGGAPRVRSTHRDPELRMHAAFGVTEAALVLVRPDGYVAFRNQPADPAALLDYLTTIFVS
jgi:2-polyprenyl-6-methoxyphenol hydroxylase-like FAD-dependent oxidoreductase